MKEPIRKKWIWWVLGVLVLFNAPWFLPEGSIEPFILGVPYWVLLVVILSVALAAFLHWACMTQWNIVEDAEEAARAAAATGQVSAQYQPEQGPAQGPAQGSGQDTAQGTDARRKGGE
ncbi:MAG TPA: hypothetical protein H9871_02055 [Candidatus Nesterenkonia stercoripullorum]|uniref:DUF3311 domain-containing protein n=1 Tax=Candidatus Nesterenkonia stercoripullorum TaxID=2838701 RepID=A0A9D1US75_9MICC|nr:hypothetical protein [Candidatus Nesterenkonia stercoripullorum]